MIKQLKEVLIRCVLAWTTLSGGVRNLHDLLEHLSFKVKVKHFPSLKSRWNPRVAFRRDMVKKIVRKLRRLEETHWRRSGGRQELLDLRPSTRVICFLKSSNPACGS